MGNVVECGVFVRTFWPVFVIEMPKLSDHTVASYDGSPGSIQGNSVVDLCWTEQHCVGLYLNTSGFRCQLCDQYSILISSFTRVCNRLSHIVCHNAIGPQLDLQICPYNWVSTRVKKVCVCYRKG
jgi:hypothetical protein